MSNNFIERYIIITGNKNKTLLKVPYPDCELPTKDDFVTYRVGPSEICTATVHGILEFDTTSPMQLNVLDFICRELCDCSPEQVRKATGIFKKKEY